MPIEYYKATVLTWGTERGQNGISKQIKNRLYGGGFGHASIKLTFPADARGAGLIKEYCQYGDAHIIIPYQKITKKEKNFEYKIDEKGEILFDSQGKLITEEQEKSTDFYEVYFSWWPQNNEKTTALLHNQEEDQKSERREVHVPVAGEAATDLVSQRTMHGKLSNRVITLGPELLINYPEIPQHTSSASISEYQNEELQKAILAYVNKVNVYQQNEAKYDKLMDDYLNNRSELSMLDLIELKNNLDDSKKLLEEWRTTYFANIDKFKLKVNMLAMFAIKYNLSIVAMDNFHHKSMKLEQHLKKETNNHKKFNEEVEQLTKQINSFKEQAYNSHIEQDAISEFFTNEFNEDIKQYVSYGEKPTHEIELPLVDEKNNNVSQNTYGLGLENMLAKMRDLATDTKGFDLYSKNCSATSLTIINAGIREEDKKWMSNSVKSVDSNFKDQDAILFKILTPQNVYNSSSKLAKNINKKQKNALTVSQIKGEELLDPVFKQFNRKTIVVETLYKVIDCIKNLFVNKQKYETINRPSAITFVKQPLTSNDEKINVACYKELDKIFKSSQEYLKNILYNPNQYEDVKEKQQLLSIIENLTTKSITINGQMCPSSNNEQTSQLMESINKNFSDITFLLNETDPKVREAWLSNYKKTMDSSN